MTDIALFHIAFELWGCLFCLLAALFLYPIRKLHPRTNTLIALELCNAVMVLSDAFAWGYRGTLTASGYYIVRISNILVFLSSYLLYYLFARYVDYLAFRNDPHPSTFWSRGVTFFTAVGFLLILSAQFFPDFIYAYDSTNHYYRTEYAWTKDVVPIFNILLTSIEIYIYRDRFRKKELRLFCFLLTIPLLVISYQIFHYGISFSNIAFTIVVLLLFVFHHMDYADHLIRQEQEQSARRIHLLESQIQPHFIFNCLTIIRQLCRTDVKEAIAAIEDFSSYMRSISNSLTLDRCVTAEEELRTVKYYLSMEKRRFGKDLQTEFNIEDNDFQLPAFSIQVVAENAVRHGIRKNQPPSGTVSIHTFRGNGRHVVEIRDNGAGFIPGQLSPAELKHVGLENVSERLRIMCGGTMRIDSAPGKGTRVRIEIPENTEEYRK
ncbi:MAG: histidine kinase [Acidaminococcaceae bacterium]|nr:histidine kinase [Acidaminococcaceae bacterium]